MLLAAKGMQNKDIAADVGLDRRQVSLWRTRFLEGGIEALRQDAPRSGRPASVMAEMESRIVRVTLHEKPANATHWSTRTLAEHLGVGATTVRTAWRNNGLKPQPPRSSGLASQASPIRHALHPDQRIVAEHRSCVNASRGVMSLLGLTPQRLRMS